MVSLKVSFTQLVLCILLGVTCTNGKPPTAIVGGFTAADGEFPYQVSLRLNNQHICGGSIVGSRHIVTAAHCVEEGNKLVNSMTVVTSTNSLVVGGHRYNIRSITKHPLYSPHAKDSWRNDVAVIALTTPITFDSRTKMIKLPTRNAPGGATAIASGWGNHLYSGGPIPDDLRKLEVKVIAPGQCKFPGSGPITENHLCTSAKSGSGICSGDSGGPLMSNGELIGIASFAIPCGKGYPDVFTRVYSYVNWIKQVAQNT